MAESARACIEVTAGLIPGTPMPEYTKQIWITSAEWQEAGAKGAELLAERQGQAMAYAQLLMFQPHTLNWVRTDWVWF